MSINQNVLSLNPIEVHVSPCMLDRLLKKRCTALPHEHGNASNIKQNTLFKKKKQTKNINQTGAQLPLDTNDITAVHHVSMATTADPTHPSLSYWYEI